MTRPRPAGMILIVTPLLALALPAAEARAGGLRPRRAVVGGAAGPAMGGVPFWAAQRMAASPGPVPVAPYGRRPWAYGLNMAEMTPAARMARYYQLGGGVGPQPGFNEGPSYFVPHDTFNYPYLP